MRWILNNGHNNNKIYEITAASSACALRHFQIELNYCINIFYIYIDDIYLYIIIPINKCFYIYTYSIREYPVFVRFHLIICTITIYIYNNLFYFIYSIYTCTNIFVYIIIIYSIIFTIQLNILY